MSESSAPMRRTDEVNDTLFVCPDSPRPVSRAVHLARLNSGWSGCDLCPSRMDTEGLTQRTAESVASIRESRAGGLRRTEFGVRGPYLNALDRRTAADLTRVFLASMERLPAPVAGNPQKSVAVGFDRRSSSPDLFVAVLSAIHEAGIPVLDLGRTTPAAIEAVLRVRPDCRGALLVTGAGAPTSWNGLDAFDELGQPLAVAWREFGIGLISIDHQRETDMPPAANIRRPDPAAGIRFTLEDVLQRKPETSARTAMPIRSRESDGRTPPQFALQLPDDAVRRGWHHQIRRDTLPDESPDFESHYIGWLQSWFPHSVEQPLDVQSSDPLVQSRVLAIGAATGLPLRVRGSHETAPPAAGSIFCEMQITDDDRDFQLLDTDRSLISAPELADRVNRGLRGSRSAVTAHADPVTDRFWLTDTGRRADRPAIEHIRDALAVLGLVLRLHSLNRWSP